MMKSCKFFSCVFFLVIYLGFGNIALADNRVLYGKYISYADLQAFDVELKEKPETFSDLDVALIFGEPTLSFIDEDSIVWVYYFIDAGDGDFYRDIFRSVKFIFDSDRILIAYDFLY